MIRPKTLSLMASLTLLAGLVMPAGVAMPSAAFADNAETYLSYLPDVPLMSGMTEVADQAVVFDKAEGRVMETAVLAPLNSEKDVFDFYGTTLPALGWQKLTPDRFLRNGEQLVVKWEKVSDGALVRFSLSPKPPLKQEKNY